MSSSRRRTALLSTAQSPFIYWTARPKFMYPSDTHHITSIRKLDSWVSLYARSSRDSKLMWEFGCATMPVETDPNFQRKTHLPRLIGIFFSYHNFDASLLFISMHSSDLLNQPPNVTCLEPLSSFLFCISVAVDADWAPPAGALPSSSIVRPAFTIYDTQSKEIPVCS